MANTILLSIAAAILPDGTANNAAPAVQRVKSSGADPKPFFLQLAFDATTDEMAMWSFRMPSDYASSPVLKVQAKMASATSGNIVSDGRIAAVTPADSQDVDAKAFAAANSSGAVAVPGTAGHLFEFTITLSTNDSLAAGDFVVVYLSRDANHASDTAAGDMEVIGVSLEYTAS